MHLPFADDNTKLAVSLSITTFTSAALSRAASCVEVDGARFLDVNGSLISELILISIENPADPSLTCHSIYTVGFGQLFISSSCKFRVSSRVPVPVLVSCFCY